MRTTHLWLHRLLRTTFLGMMAMISSFSIAAESPAPAPLPWPTPTQIVKLWPGDAPGLVTPAKAEEIVNERIRNVSVPELWIYQPEKKSDQKRTAMLICAGGGYSHLAMGLHVGNVVKLFHDQDVVVIALKYRTRYGANAVAEDAMADCARAIRFIRQQGDAWGIHRVGFQGYSAGANIGLNLLGHFDDGDPQSTDPVERFSSRPDFMALMCPWPNGKPISHYSVKKNPPPVFIASAEDDRTALTSFALEIAEAVKKQGGTVQLFVVPTGGHAAFHYGVEKGPGAKWPDAFLPMINK